MECDTDPFLGTASPSRWCLQQWRVGCPLIDTTLARDDDTYVVRSFQVTPTRFLAWHCRQDGVCSHDDDDTYVVRSSQAIVIARWNQPVSWQGIAVKMVLAAMAGRLTFTSETDPYLGKASPSTWCLQPCETDPYLGKASPSKWCLQPWRVESPLPGTTLASPGDLLSLCGLQTLKAVLSMRHVMKIITQRDVYQSRLGRAIVCNISLSCTNGRAAVRYIESLRRVTLRFSGVASESGADRELSAWKCVRGYSAASQILSVMMSLKAELIVCNILIDQSPEVSHRRQVLSW
ncbi:hypothetical protein Tco_0701255 [Tanacetum coccineum]